MNSEELDLAIPDMDTETAELAVRSSLLKVTGIIGATIMQRGALIRYNSDVITKDEVCSIVRQAGFRASIFQDSKTGQTGLSSQ